ncbi:MAG: signal peptidase II [Anaerococcus sp.]|uniref:signal peptidase II n=1 Tax=Anaerococcus sp. TaxID=1872515 RepID=UPI0026333284|nr:signal peptidase II [Anaerococcus sp.]MCI5972772.1 signal peptidase II [Anaerococcus sp.]MDD6919199.1 signal peptidase II [Peptoniphilaceae bacterium]MDY2927710.1 signal peptidase II [Anaerococcus sp.]
MIYLLIIILGLVIDRLTKIYAVNNLMERTLDGKLINLTYLENRGAAFGILQDKRLIFIILTTAIVIYLLYYFLKNIKTSPMILNLSLAMIISGAIGNFYDRLIQGYVVDFIEFSFVRFPVFNVADILVTAGCTLMIIYIILHGDK